MRPIDYAQAPLLFIWETTRACALACRHCRASAEDIRDPRELSLGQGKDLLRQVKAMGTPLMVLTGGDPLQRDDLEELIRYGKSMGLVMATIPAATPRLTKERIRSLAQAGVDQLALSLDGATAETHDRFRQVEGTYAKVIEGAGWIREAGVPLQINTVFGAWNVDEFDAIAAKVEKLGTAFWEIFFLVPIGRGSQMQGCSIVQMEFLFEKIHTLSKRAPFRIKVTEGQQYRRFYHQKEKKGDRLPWLGNHPQVSPQPVNAGLGICFVSHTGSIQPSGFLPLDCGNVRTAELATVYQDHPTFRDLRDLTKVHGKCSRCPELAYCSGGSRARAYAMTGDALASDPMCGIGCATR